MRVIHGLDEERDLPARCVLTVGNFDGVHRGHQRIIAVAREQAQPEKLPVVALTFEPHPLAVVSPATAPQRLTLAEGKLALLADAGVDLAVVAKSTPQFLSLVPEVFIKDVMVARFHPAHVVEGRNFGFGRGRRGNLETLQHYASQLGYDVHVVEPVTEVLGDGTRERVSSSLIRKLLSAGQVELAASAMGRPHALTGTVVKGASRGRSLGFPTANLAVPDNHALAGQLIPGDGVYAGQVVVHDRSYGGAISVGQALTFEGSARHVEAHLIGFDADLYGETIIVDFERRLRDQRKFGSREELARQIHKDVESARQCGIDRQDQSSRARQGVDDG